MSGMVEALSLSGLVAGTLEYAILMRHRQDRRDADQQEALTTTLGHEALVRMHLLDRSRPNRRWGAFGSRFR
jgi:hypothetical protein